MLLVTPLSLLAATQSNSSLRFFEGDILLPPSLAGDYDIQANTLPLSERWTRGVVPYIIKKTFKQNEIRTIEKAMEEMREGHKNYSLANRGVQTLFFLP